MHEILQSENFKRVLKRELLNVKSNLQIISAYCKQNALEFVDASLLEQPIVKRLIVRFRMDDIISNATDFSIYDYCKRNKWQLYILNDLHAKTYVFDKKRWIVGSANLTSNGIGITTNGNREMSLLVDVDESEHEKITKIFDSATLMTDELAKLMNAQLSKVSVEGQMTTEWSAEINKLLNKRITTIFTHDFPKAKSPYLISKEDIELLSTNENPSIEQIKQAFMSSRCLKWLTSVLLEKLNNQEYFGALSAILHETLVNDPKPYRKEVKELLSILLNWIDELKIDNIIVERPNYSQLVKLI